ncbi:MAG TPA: hypothetical protein VJU34_10995, partial [Phenylobacterium sp.]|nr:hypothetical protein [Phenylobacterium sp.]
MTASALNIASIAPAAQLGAGANAPHTGGLAGFEALLGALFPQADAGATLAPAASPPLSATPGAQASPDLLADGALSDTGKDATDPGVTADVAPTEGQPTAGDAAAALVASLIAVNPAPVETQVTTGKDADASPAAS